MGFYVNRGHSPLKEGITAYRYGSTCIECSEKMFDSQGSDKDINKNINSIAMCIEIKIRQY